LFDGGQILAAASFFFSYSTGEMAETGQVSAQMPQSVQISGLIL